MFKDRNDRLIGRYCALTAPGPIESHEEAEGIRLVLHTDEEGVFSGFKARYIFFTAKSIFGGIILIINNYIILYNYI